MPCHHLREMFEICSSHHLKLSSSDLIRIVCPSCGVTEECPSMLLDEYEDRHKHDAETAADEPARTVASK